MRGLCNKRDEVAGLGLERWLQDAFKNVNSLHLSALPPLCLCLWLWVIGGHCTSSSHPLRSRKKLEGESGGVCEK